MKALNSSVFQNTIPKMSFIWLDYVFLIATLTFSTSIGIYFGCFGSKQKSILEYLMGNKAMKPVPIAISLVASHIAVVILIAIPVETYRFGAYYLIAGISLTITCVVAIYVYLPVFINLEITSIHEYLEIRFDRKARLLTSFLYALYTMLQLSLVMYVTALTCSVATGLSVHILTLILFCVCVIYTSFGGLKGVVWTDILQCVIMLGTVLIILVLGIKSEGFGQIFKKALEGQRFDIFDFHLDPTRRNSFWGTLIGFSFTNLVMLGVHQTSMQKFLSLSKFRDCVLSIICFVILFFATHLVVVFIGLTTYARYSDCDPFTSNSIQKNDQLIPYFVMDIAGYIPGMSGLFIAGVVSAALSTLSAGLNCMAGTIYEDFIKLFLKKYTHERKIYIYLRLLVAAEGIICMSLVYMIQNLGDLLPLILSFQAVTSGPTLGIFTLGLLFPRANSKGAFAGTLIGSLATATIVFPSKYYQAKGLIRDLPLPVSTSGCQFFSNQTIYQIPVKNMTSSVVPSVPYIFKISFLYHTVIGTLITLLMGLIISYLTSKSTDSVDEKLISPVSRFLLQKNEKIRTRYSSVEGALSRVRANQE